MSAMRELTVRIKFTKHCLGNQKSRTDHRFRFQRNPATGHIIFLAAWHKANFRMASSLLNLHQDEVDKIHWDINIDGNLLRENPWHKSYYRATASAKQRYSLHEVFRPGMIIGINCAVPVTITDQDFWRLMTKAGQYCGLSPWKPGEFGHFTVISVRPRQNSIENEEPPEKLEAEVETIKQQA